MRDHLTNPVELLYLSLMLRWERNAPPNGHKGLLDSLPEVNSQITRFAYVLDKIAAYNDYEVYQTFARHSHRNDGRSYISTDPTWMIDPRPLTSGWYFEGCTSLKQKQQCTRCVTKLGLSPLFERCFDDFIEGKSVRSYLPTLQEQNAILEALRAKANLDFDDGATATPIEQIPPT